MNTYIEADRVVDVDSVGRADGAGRVEQVDEREEATLGEAGRSHAVEAQRLVHLVLRVAVGSMVGHGQRRRHAPRGENHACADRIGADSLVQVNGEPAVGFDHFVQMVA